MNVLFNLQRAVVAVNKHLIDVVQTMEPIILLRNCSPDDRPFHASQLYKEGIITKFELGEFAKIVGGHPVLK